MDIDSNNDMDVDVDHDVTITSSLLPAHMQSISWVAPPSAAESSSTGVYDICNNWITYSWGKDKPSANIEPFCNRWPPSCTSSRWCAWISVNCGLSPAARNLGTDEYGARFKRDYKGLEKEFDAITRGGEVKVTPEVIDALAVKYGVLSGKWMVYSKSESVDQMWRKIVRLVALDRGYGQAKVSARKVLDDPQYYAKLSINSEENLDGGAPAPGEDHVICVYVDDYTNKQEVDELRKALRFRAGVFWKIGFKADVYTRLNIYKGNEWGLRPSRYHDLDYQSGGLGRTH
ncbi:hypothetical protein D9756_010052 [Leucocoprinus leucothites]|uniref:Uncharacterized protein n=1 Tax=Leucocoprinus leucothites TaxID=201217 RepID=A0A8H5CTU0_9AGAR|nr:hypothetical protein D9756_010052 [Leucoagaricus leucothites]